MKRNCISNLLLVVIAFSAIEVVAEPIDIGFRRELFVDDFLIERMDNVALRLHHPVAREVAVTTDAPWEGNISCYVTVFQDGPMCRMYYRGANYDVETKTYGGERVCYAESPDGIHWEKPALGLFDYEGSKENNIVWEGPGIHNFSPFLDTNPACAPESRYKALVSSEEERGLLALQSADAIHWSVMQDKPVITEGAFDSQNLGFWDAVRGEYVEFHRGFKDGVRAIMTSTSQDFIHWTPPVWLDYGDTPDDHLYTNATIAYPRAPHIFMAFPKRFVPSRTGAVHPLPGVSDGVFMTSRDGRQWNRWREAFIRPGLQPSRWVNRNNMTAWGMLETAPSLPGTPPELSLYTTEGYYVGPCHVRRHSMRPDGFVSVHGGAEQGEFVTKVLTFQDDPGSTVPETPSIRTRKIVDGIRGKGALAIDEPLHFALPGTRDLGKEATFAAQVRGVPKGHRRLFSAYDGGGVAVTQGEMWFDFDSSGEGVGIRFCANGTMISVPSEKLGDWSDGPARHLAATWEDGRMCIYVDGVLAAEGGEAGGGPLSFLHGDVQFGEDYAPAAQANEPFIGHVDDIAVLPVALDAAAIMRMAKEGATALGEAGKGGILLDFEGNDAAKIRNAWNTTQTLPLPGYQPPVHTRLLLNVSTSAFGSVRCELIGADGAPLPGFSLEDCDEIFGDSLALPVTWRSRSELLPLSETPLRIRFVLQDADLYAMKFE
jgi:hypothetical protein